MTLTNIPVHVSGEFSCEITTEAPRLSTSCVSNNLTVVDLNLDLHLPLRNYQFGDVLEAKCSLTPQLPSTILVFHWNLKIVSTH